MALIWEDSGGDWVLSPGSEEGRKKTREKPRSSENPLYSYSPKASPLGPSDTRDLSSGLLPEKSPTSSPQARSMRAASSRRGPVHSWHLG